MRRLLTPAERELATLPVLDPNNPAELSVEVSQIVEQLASRHGDIRLAAEASGLHVYMASPACLVDDGDIELSKKHLAVNLEKYARGNDWCAMCMKTRTPYRLSMLLEMPPLDQRGFSSEGRVKIVKMANPDDLEPDGNGNFIPKSPGTWFPINTLPESHPVIQYVRRRNYDPQALWDQFRCAWCEQEHPNVFYRELLRGFRATPQGRLVFFIDNEGVNRGWQARVLEWDEGDIRHFFHPYRREWLPVLQLDREEDRWKPLPGWEGWDMPKYIIGRGCLRNQSILGLDAAIKSGTRKAILTEGPLDAARFGIPGQAMMGKFLSKDQANLLATHFDRVIFVAQNDAAGESAKERVAKELGLNRPGFDLRFVDTPDPFKDPGEMSPAAAWDLVKGHLT